MRNKILAMMVLGLFVTVFSTVAVLSYMQHRATKERFEGQHSAILKIAVTNVEMGISTGRIASVQKFLNGLMKYPIFDGAIVYDADSTAIMTIPKDFELQTSESELFSKQKAKHENISYEIAALEDDDNELLGHLLISFTFSPVKNQARKAVLLTVAFGLFILLPVMGIIAWRLRWYERALRKNEMNLLQKNQTLEVTKASLAEAKSEIEHMLNNLDQGIFTINPDCSVNAEHSKRAQDLFTVNDFQNAGLDDIFTDERDSINVFKKWVDLVQEPRFLKNWEMYEKLNPFREIRRTNGKEQILKVEYTPIIENDSLVKIMVLATDITEKIKSQQALEKSRQEQQALVERVIALVSNDKSFVNSFMSDMEKYLTEFQAIASEKDLNRDLGQLYRDTHTIKGNAGTLGFGKLARHASQLEDLFLALKEEKDINIYDQWRQRLQEFQAEFTQIVDLSQKISSDDKDSFAISQKRYEELLQKIASGEISEIGMIFERIEALNSKPLEFYCRKYQRIVELYREKYDKKIENLQVTTPDLLVHHDIMKALDPSIIHIIRNAVDHGIESDKERKNVNKGPGIITISFTNEQSGRTLTVSDNGKGLDPDFIAQRAVKRGIITKEDRLSQDQKIDLIFEPGFSTKEETTEISGRGVGMDAVRANMEKLNGSVKIESEPGKGTSIILHLENRVNIVKEDKELVTEN